MWTRRLRLFRAGVGVAGGPDLEGAQFAFGQAGLDGGGEGPERRRLDRRGLDAGVGSQRGDQAPLGGDRRRHERASARARFDDDLMG